MGIRYHPLQIQHRNTGYHVQPPDQVRLSPAASRHRAGREYLEISLQVDGRKISDKAEDHF